MTAIARPVPSLRTFAAAVLSALAVAVMTQAVTVLLFFVGAGADSATLVQLGDYFLGASLCVFVVLAIFGVVGVYRYWYVRVVAALVAGVVAALVGTALTIVLRGTALSPSILSQLFATLIGPNLVFVIVVVLSTLTVGVWVFSRVTGAPATPGERRIALVRAPADNLAEGEVTHVDRTAIDTDLANDQWDAYVAAFADNGWDIVEVPVANTLADSVFIEDAVVLFGDTAVITSPGAESRRDEIVDAEATVREAGLRVERIVLPGTLDGGDVLKVGSTVYVGRGGRTNAEGIRQLRAIVARLGYTVVAVPVTKALHLKSAVTALPDGTVIGYPPVVDDPAIFDRFLAMPEEGGAHVVTLAPDTVLMAASAPASAALIADLGYRVVTVDISEFEKLEGCVTCLSVRVR
ncbi:dimethylargininase [Lacisediminihabitans profunda]|uniref:Dimethylarginine dimethylaminohydrolase n=1 Tax=Lacisediminihabitans profunda TaxID=2594790 RepID=A0A5C8UW74_9MICO|nr:dimethylargininase [Lacisediminihabitans profunda]TXN32612.1 dimethylarginine dimethylaminohydrolase [Lacisediminihabitans profunda]